MKNENESIRSLFDRIGPDETAVSRMEKNILDAHAVKPRRKFRPAVLAAAVLAAVLSVGTISAAPAVRRYFFPDAGIVETDGTDEAPLYMMLDAEENSSGDYEILAGYWYDGTAKVWITSETCYEEIPIRDVSGSQSASVELLGVNYDSGSGYTQTYLIEYADVSWDAAYEGLPFMDDSLRFAVAPAEYRPYILENCGVRLTLIPLTRDLTTFAAEAEYTDGHDSIELLTKSSYSAPRDAYAMYLTDELGGRYPLKRLKNSSVLTISSAPEAEITGFTADYIVIRRVFDESEAIEVPLPADGEIIETDIGFTFPDGVTKGNISSVGYNSPGEYLSSGDFPLGYLTVVTDAVEQNGIEYWYELSYTDEYYGFLSSYTVTAEKSPYDRTADPLAPGYSSVTAGLDDQVMHIEHYVSDGSGSVCLRPYFYDGIAYGDWTVEFTPAG